MKRGILIAAPLLSMTLAACSGSSPGSAPMPVSSASAQMLAVPAPEAIEHVHNVALLDDDAIVIGTHEGLWRQDRLGAQLQRVGPESDVMGFAVAKDRWLVSGHPASGDDGPADLGLLESTDEAKSWTTIGLEGQVDFHRIASSGSTILGANSGDGRLWKSLDKGSTWTTLSPAPFDIALDPDDPEYVVGTTAEGPVTSSDGGRSWAPASSDKPLVALVAWQGQSLIGAGPQGEVYESSDRGQSWQKVAKVDGQPSALAVRGSSVVVISGATLWQSRDAGRTFESRITGIPTG